MSSSTFQNFDGDGWVNVRTKQCNEKSPNEAAVQQVIIILVGLPGSGKSFFACSLERKSLSRFVRINQDSLGTRQKCITSARKALSVGKSVVVDRCNFDTTQREHWIKIGKEFGVACECIFFNYNKSLCIQRCRDRSNHPTIDRRNAASVINGMAKQLRVPTPNSPLFSRIITVTSFRKSNEVVQSYLDRSLSAK